MAERHWPSHLPRGVATIAAAALMASCEAGSDTRADKPSPRPNSGGEVEHQARAPDDAAAPTWDIASSGEGVALVLAAGDRTTVRLFCPAASGRILVNVPTFHPIGSEERLSFGSGGAVEALVADTRGDSQRGGVSGTGAVPGNLPALIAGPLSVNYGAQNSGPHPAPPRQLARAFAGACREAASEPKVSACLMQDGERLSVEPLRAIGTEPFWGARIEGRCVTYSHIEDQTGTRVWTRYTARKGGGGTWTGALGGEPFVLAIRREPGCSDGMSDRRYPMAVTLTVNGQERRGCALEG